MIVYATDRLWQEAVVLEAGSRVLRVQSTRDAWLCLRNHWPDRESEAAQKALALCEQGLAAAGDDPLIARQAFIEAARAAGFRVNSWTEGSSDAVAAAAATDEERAEWIAKRAYSLWEADGRVHGKDEEHWRQAVRERDELERVALPGHLERVPDRGDERTEDAIRKARQDL